MGIFIIYFPYLFVFTYYISGRAVWSMYVYLSYFAACPEIRYNEGQKTPIFLVQQTNAKYVICR